MSGGASVLIVGSGIMGAAVARRVLDEHPDARITMISGGPRIGGIPGQHLHDSPDPAVRREFSRSAAVNSQNLYVGANQTEARGAAGIRTGMTAIGALGDDGAAMPGAAVAWNEGGMSVHWAGGTPVPSGHEVPAFLDADEWRGDLDTAERLLRVTSEAFPLDRTACSLLGVLESTVGARNPLALRPRRMPMALEQTADGTLVRTGPNRILPEMTEADGERLRLVEDTLCTRVIVESGRATGVETRHLPTGAAGRLEADVVVVAADALRTPQLLFASGIRPPALGTHLNEHAFVTGAVLVDPETLGVAPAEVPAPDPDEPFLNSLWVPQGGEEQPFHAGMLVRAHVRADQQRDYLVTMSWYVPTEISAGNRVAFSSDETDAAGLPRMALSFDYSARDLDLIARARAEQAAVARRLSADAAEHTSAVLPPGSSLHYTGTVRMGPVDDGTSVCDSDGRVWGHDNLYLAGNGVVPTALVCNATLTGVTLAVRTARAIIRALPLGKTSLSPAAQTCAIELSKAITTTSASQQPER